MNISVRTYLALDNGNYAVQPNNRILWDAPNYTV